MKLNKLIFIHAFIVLVAVATGCKQEPGETFELKEKLDGKGKIRFNVVGVSGTTDVMIQELVSMIELARK